MQGDTLTASDQANRQNKKWVFPRLPIKDVQFFIDKIMSVGMGEDMRRTVLLDACKLGDSGPTRDKLIVSQAYGLTIGGSRSDFIKPTELGSRLIHASDPRPVLLDIIQANSYFQKFHDRYADKRVPTKNIRYLPGRLTRL